MTEIDWNWLELAEIDWNCPVLLNKDVVYLFYNSSLPPQGALLTEGEIAEAVAAANAKAALDRKSKTLLLEKLVLVSTCEKDD